MRTLTPVRSSGLPSAQMRLTCADLAFAQADREVGEVAVGRGASCRRAARAALAAAVARRLGGSKPPPRAASPRSPRRRAARGRRRRGIGAPSVEAITSRSESRGPCWRARRAPPPNSAWSISVAGQCADQPAGDRADRAEQRAAGRGAARRKGRRAAISRSLRESGTHRRAAAATTARWRPRRRTRRRGRAPSALRQSTIAACLAG